MNDKQNDNNTTKKAIEWLTKETIKQALIQLLKWLFE